MIDLVGSRDACGPDCDAFIAKWSAWWAQKTREPVAMLQVVDSYWDDIGVKSRNMVRKANALYQFRRFDFNDRLAEIEAINRSKPVRAGGPMQGWYTQPVTATTPSQLCALHSDEWYGGFNEDDVLVGYVRLEVLNQLGIINSILGHVEAPAVVNGLIAHLVEYSGVYWINYLYPQGSSQGLTDFKRRVGFRPMVVPASSTPVARSLT